MSELTRLMVTRHALTLCSCEDCISEFGKQLIAIIRYEIDRLARFEPAGWNGLCEESNAGYHLDRDQILALLAAQEKELGWATKKIAIIYSFPLHVIAITQFHFQDQ